MVQFEQKFDYIKIINNLKKINASKYNPNELMYSLFDKVSKKKIQTLKNINNIDWITNISDCFFFKFFKMY